MIPGELLASSLVLNTKHYNLRSCNFGVQLFKFLFFQSKMLHTPTSYPDAVSRPYPYFTVGSTNFLSINGVNFFGFKSQIDRETDCDKKSGYVALLFSCWVPNTKHIFKLEIWRSSSGTHPLISPTYIGFLSQDTKQFLRFFLFLQEELI